MRFAVKSVHIPDMRVRFALAVVAALSVMTGKENR